MNDYFKELKPSNALLNTMWEHTNGNRYIIRMFTNVDTTDEERYPVTVVYMGENGKLWSRPISDWLRSFKHVPEYNPPKTKEIVHEQRDSLPHGRGSGNL